MGLKESRRGFETTNDPIIIKLSARAVRIKAILNIKKHQIDDRRERI